MSNAQSKKRHRRRLYKAIRQQAWMTPDQPFAINVNSFEVTK